MKWWYTWKRAISAPNFFLSKWIPANKNDESFAILIVRWVYSCSCHRRSLVAADLSSFPSTSHFYSSSSFCWQPKNCSGHNNPDLLGLIPTKNWTSFQYSPRFFSTLPFCPLSLCKLLRLISSNPFYFFLFLIFPFFITQKNCLF